MPLSDETLMRWMRGHVSDGLSALDIGCAGDVSHLQPLLFLLARFGGNFASERNHVYVEIGVADGSTTLPLLKAAAEMGGIVHSVDPSGCDRAKELVKIFGYEDHWRFHNEKSDDFFAKFHDSIHFAFIDGDHSWPVVERDFVNCYERLRPGGMIVSHDFSGLSVGHAPFDHETGYEEQCSCGHAKALLRAAPKMPGVTAVNIGVSTACLLRKPQTGELLLHDDASKGS